MSTVMPFALGEAKKICKTTITMTQSHHSLDDMYFNSYDVMAEEESG